jgi:hypothetical protein
MAGHGALRRRRVAPLERVDDRQVTEKIPQLPVRLAQQEFARPVALGARRFDHAPDASVRSLG